MQPCEYLEHAIRNRGWSIPDLAREAGVSFSLAYKWLSEDAAYRTVPSPASCYKIAAALREDPDRLLEVCGHRQPRPASEPLPDPIAVELATTSVEMREVLRDIPRQYWSTILRTTGRSAVQHARDLVEMLRTADNAASNTENKRSRTTLSDTESGLGPNLTVPLAAAAA